MNKFPNPAPFADRHLGPSEDDVAQMLETLGQESLEALIREVVPDDLYRDEPLSLPPALSETGALERLREMLSVDESFCSFIGRGYYGTITPAVIQRCVLENPGWYTSYTPYQAEISQGRLEALLNFQTMICDLTALPVANASLLDEATAAAEAMALAAGARSKAKKFLVTDDCFPQTIDVMRTRAAAVGIELEVVSFSELDFAKVGADLIGVLLQYPTQSGEIRDLRQIVSDCHAVGGVVVVAADLLSLVLLEPPGSWGADLVIGSAQRFGVPMGFGGPHAAYMACQDALKRRLPGRLIGVSRDADERPAFRLSLQTREQHIRREKATSNICTAQALLAIMAGFYAVYHGPRGLERIARRVHGASSQLADALKRGGYDLLHDTWFDTLTIRVEDTQRQEILMRAQMARVNLRTDQPGQLSFSLDEACVESGDWKRLFEVFSVAEADIEKAELSGIPDTLCRTAPFLTQPVFNRFQTETELMRYLRRLEGKDIALNWSMIPLGSCTMKLNAAAEMMPLSWSAISSPHPFAPSEQTRGYRAMIAELESWLSVITGLDASSVQPNAGSQGEYAGLLAIRRYLDSRGEQDRRACLIPTSAHGTNPASAVMAGFEVVAVACDSDGNIDTADLAAKIDAHSDRLGALMITYPSTHGVFEEGVSALCETIHRHGGQVYMDGANLNAQVGLCSPGSIGADVCHLNLHKTFCIPHGGGGPGVGPICVRSHLAPFLPGHGEWSDHPDGAVSAAPYGSASILTISWMYLAMMGPSLRRATEIAMLNANYIAARLDPYFPVLYRGKKGRVAHECIIDLRGFKESSGIEVEDVAKRLIDFGFHAPTMSWPVAGTLMIEPTESESREELDRFCDAMIAIYDEIGKIVQGEADREDNALKRAPHPAESLLSETWNRAYTRESAAYPLPWVRERKFWPPVSRIDNVYGDRHLVCTCDGMENYAP